MPNRRSVLTGLGAGVAAFALQRSAQAQKDDGRRPAREVIAVLGTGHFGGAIGQRLAAIGHTVLYGSRTPESARVKALVRVSGPRASAASEPDAASRGGIVVFAVPWTPVKEMLPNLGDLSGKLIIDPMIANPRTVDRYPFPPDPSSSAAEKLQTWLPGAQVVSAFSTIRYEDLANPSRADGPISIPIAGADRDANERVARLVFELGLDPKIIGTLIAARYLESLLWMEVAYNTEPDNKRTRAKCEIYMRRVPV